ncbi:hypothetical protein [Phaeospirillum tilakii]|uniref:Uncharacterized protein n=1 Tax=Phaeospirillum tilakii TaxID=741673 RepID=A0ABW5CCC2_9PROT
MYPGTKKDFVRQFVSEGCIFLELPGLELEVADFSNLERNHLLLSKIARAKAYASWHLKESDARGSYPSTDLQDYFDDGRSRSAAMSFRNFERLFRVAKVGDIIIVPEDNGFQSKLYIGEIYSDFDIEDTALVRQFGNHRVPIRKVRWLRKDFERRLVSVSLSKQLGGRRAVRPVPTDTFGYQLFKLAYQNFIFDGQAQYAFAGEKYDNDPAATVPGIQLLTYALAAANASLSCPDLISKLGLDELRDTGLHRKGLITFEIKFASPGGYGVWQQSARVLLIALSLVALSGCDWTSDEAQAAKVVNSGGDLSPEEMRQIQDSYQHIVSNLSPSKIDALRNEHRKAKKGVGFESKVKISK